MSTPKNSAGIMRKFGQTSYISVSNTLQSGHKIPPKTKSKFFVSRDLKIQEDIIEEESEEAETNIQDLPSEDTNIQDLPSEGTNNETLPSESANIQDFQSESANIQDFQLESTKSQDFSSESTKTQDFSSESTNIQDLASDSTNIQEYASNNEEVANTDEDWSCGNINATPELNNTAVVSKEDNIKNNLVEENGIRDLSPEITSCTPGPSQSISSKQYFDNSSVVHSTLNKTSTSSLESGSGASVFQTPSLPRKNKTSNIKVAVRCRPMLQNEINSDEMSVVDVDEGHVIVALKKSFKFDINLDKDVEQERVYELCVHPVVEKVIDKYNGCVFAYGQTGTGKTYTMGTHANHHNDIQSEGVIPRTLKDIFASNNMDCSIKVSFYEILNEQVFDLLDPHADPKVPLVVRENVQLGFFDILQLTQLEVNSVDDAIKVLHKGNESRTTECTNQNESSSRSHAIFTIYISSGDGVTRKLNLVDLAGSESVGGINQEKSGVRTQGININRGLLNLGNVIRAVAEKKTHIPYRDSILTKVLKECLQLTSFVSMIACISPSNRDMNETISTLRFANKAKELVSRPVPAHLLQSAKLSVAKKRKMGELIGETPRPKFNSTIHTPTPSKVRRWDMKSSTSRKRMNFTIATPDKARNEQRRFNCSNSSASSYDKADSPTLQDISGVSFLRHEEHCETNTTSSQATRYDTTLSVQDITAIFSPYMRKFKSEMLEEIRKGQQPEETLRKKDYKNTPRMTSSPIQSQSVEEYNVNNACLKDITNNDNTSPTLSTAHRNVEESLMCQDHRMLPDNPSSQVLQSVPNKEFEPAVSSTSPTIEEMQKSLGISEDDDLLGGLLFCDPSSTSGNQQLPDKKKSRTSRRSARRTSMMGAELEASLKFIRDDTREMSELSASSRPVRAAARGVFYGSPTQKKDKSNQENAVKSNTEDQHPLLTALAHPLLGAGSDEHSVAPERQQAHNDSILTLLNTGNLKLLTRLPAIGPKTGLIIHGYRSLNGGIKSLKDLETINGLGSRFYKKFLMQNQIVFIDED